MCFALRHDIWASPDSEAVFLNEAQHFDMYNNKIADHASSTTTDDERLPKLTPPSDKPNIGTKSEDTESAVQEVLHRECMDVVVYVPNSRENGTGIFAQSDSSVTVARDSADEIGGADGGAMDLDTPEPIIGGGTTVEVKDEVTTPSDAEILQSAVQTKDQPKVATYDGAQDGTMSSQSILDETASRHMMRSGTEPTEVGDSKIVPTTVASVGQSQSSTGEMSPVKTTSTTPLLVPNVSETAAKPGDVDSMLIDSTALKAAVAIHEMSAGHALASPTDELPVVHTTAFEVMPGLSIPADEMKQFMRDFPASSSGLTDAYVDLCTPQSDVSSPQASPADLCKTSATADLERVMIVHDDSPVPLDRTNGKTAPMTAIGHVSTSIESVTPGDKASKIEMSKAKGTKESRAPVAASTKRKAPESASMEPPAKKPKLIASAPPAKTMPSAAAKKTAAGVTAKTTAKMPASKVAPQSPEFVMIDSGPSTPASQSTTPPPKPSVSNEKSTASGMSGKLTGTPGPIKNGVEKTSVAVTPKPKANTAYSKKPTANKPDKRTATSSEARNDNIQVTVTAKPKSKTAAATAKGATPTRKTASRTATPSVAKDDDFADEDEDEGEDDEPNSEVGNKDIQTPARPACSRCKVIMRKELKGAHDKATKALKKAHETAVEAQKKKFNQHIADQKASLEKKAKTAADSHEKAIEKLEARLEKVKEASVEKVKDLKEKHETKVEGLTNDLDEAVTKRREVEKAAAAALKNHREDMQAKDNKLKEDTRKMKLAKKAELDDLKPEFSTAMKDKMREIRELTINQERLEKALSESTADAEAQSKAAEKWQMDYTASERRKLRAKKRVEEMEGELDAIRKSGLGSNPDVRAMRDDHEDELEEMRGRVDRARRNEAESGHRVVAEQRALFSMRAANERHKAKAVEADKVAAKVELENKVLRGMVARLSGRGGGRADVEMTG
nr:hypothetical protein B0A51_10351 [Rachicladosporium sp. CCFEE 5018]